MGGQMAVDGVGEDAVAVIEEDNDEEEEDGYYAQLNAGADLKSISDPASRER
jgi:hypothetical protein